MRTCFYNNIGKQWLVMEKIVAGNKKIQFGSATSSFGMQPQTGRNTAPMQGEGVDNSYYANRINASKDANPTVRLLGTLGTWYGINKAMDKFTPTTGGEYATSSLGKIGNFGDRIQNKFT